MNLLDDLSQEIATLCKCNTSEVLVGYQPPRLGFYITKNPISETTINVDLELIKAYLTHKYKTKLLIEDKSKYIITNVNVMYNFLKYKIGDVDYYIYWEYNLLNVSGFEINTYFENLNKDVFSVVLSKLKYGNVLRTIYDGVVSDDQISAASNIPQILTKIFNDLKLRYIKHSNIFGTLNPIGLTYALNIDSELELFELEKVYPFLKDKIMSTYIENISIFIDKIPYHGKLQGFRITVPENLKGHDLKKYRQYRFRKQAKYDFNNFYIYIIPKIMTLLELEYRITSFNLITGFSDVETGFLFDWEYLYKDL